MKKFLCIFVFAATAAWSAMAPFKRGVNLTNWMQASGTRRIQFTKYTRDDFVRIKSLGCDVIRLPINLHAMTNGAPGYAVDPLFFTFLDRAMDWAEELGLVLILDNHSFHPSTGTDPGVENALVPVWKQVAGHCKNRSPLICYEVLNEPHGRDMPDALWNSIQQRVVDAIRTVDTTHAIVVGGSGWNSYQNLAPMPAYKDARLIYTFHFYDPFLFTHQGAGWTDPSLAPLGNVPFPYDAARMPPCPAALRGTWVETGLSSEYRMEGTVKRVKELISIAADFGTARGVPLYCGEFGVYIPQSPAEDRTTWYRTVRECLEEKGIAWTIWDYQGGFGLFHRGTFELFEHDLNIPLLKALGLNVPAQTPFSIKPDTAGFTLYGDFIGQGLLDVSWISEGMVDFYSETDPASGKYGMLWTGSARTNSIIFAFKPVRDLSTLVRNGFAVDFMVKGDTPSAQFDIRFIDTKTTDPGDRPWRMRSVISGKTAAWDNEWHRVRISLSSFTEHGSWDMGAWFNPRGKFDWKAVERFEIAAEYHDLKNIRLRFDDIRVTGLETSAAHNGREPFPRAFKLDRNFPNPFNPLTVIAYALPKPGFVSLSVVDLAGREIKTLVRGFQPAGEYRAEWRPRDAASGLYFILLKTDEGIIVRKCILQK